VSGDFYPNLCQIAKRNVGRDAHNRPDVGLTFQRVPDCTQQEKIGKERWGKVVVCRPRHTLGRDPRVAAIDFVELDPNRDVAEITTRTFGSAILTFLAGLFLRLHDGWRGYDPTPIVD